LISSLEILLGIGTTRPLPPGDYTVEEIEAPIGFIALEEIYHLTIPKAEETDKDKIYNIIAESETDRADVENEVKTTSIQLTKEDSSNSNQVIEGVTFETTDYDGSSFDNRYTDIASQFKDETSETD